MINDISDLTAQRERVIRQFDLTPVEYSKILQIKALPKKMDSILIELNQLRMLANKYNEKQEEIKKSVGRRECTECGMEGYLKKHFPKAGEGRYKTKCRQCNNRIFNEQRRARKGLKDV